MHLVVIGPNGLSLTHKLSQNFYFLCLDNQSIVSVMLKLCDIIRGLDLLSHSGSVVV